MAKIDNDDPDAFNINKLFPPKKHNWKKFDPNAHPWIGTQYSDSKQATPWFTHSAGRARNQAKVQPYGAKAAGANRYNARYRYSDPRRNPYLNQQQFAAQGQPLAQPLQPQGQHMNGYQTPQQSGYSTQQSGYQTDQQSGYQNQQQNTYQQQATYQTPQPNSYQSQSQSTAASYQDTQVQQAQVQASDAGQYSTGFQADQSTSQATTGTNLQPTPMCPATCSRRCTTVCPEECCRKHFEKVADKEAGPSTFVSECPQECRTKCGIHCPQKCCGLNLCPFICRKSCLPGCPKKCCLVLKEFLPPLALPPLKLSAAICPNHCTAKCSTDCPQACCVKSEVPDKTTKCPSICLKVSISFNICQNEKRVLVGYFVLTHI